MNTLWRDVRFGARRLRRSPGFALAAVLTLALGIGATTAIFTLMYQVILRSIPVQHPEQLYKVGKDISCCVSGGMQNRWSLFSFDLYRTLRDETPGVDGAVAAVEAGAITVTARREGDAAAQPLDARVVSGNYFNVLGVQAYAGRLLKPSDDVEGAAPVAVLSHAIWQAKFHSDDSLVGHTVMLSGHPVTVVGIAAASFLSERNTADPAGVWLPLVQEPLLEPERKLLLSPNAHWLDVLIRIEHPAEVGRVERAIQLELLRWLQTNRNPTDGSTDADIAKQTTELSSASGGINNLRDEYESSLKMLLWIAGFVLLITCANMANLMLVRGMARRQELNIRTALGAPRARLVREMLTESLLLAVLGGTLALLVAFGGVKAVLAMAMKGVEINPLTASPSLPVLGFALAVSLLTGVLFGIAPAWIATVSDPADALRGANRSTRDSSAMPQRVLVILQAALSVALLSVAGLLITSLRNMEQQDFHFQPKGRLIAFVDFQAAGYSYEQLDGLYRRLDQAFEAQPGLHDFAYATYSPMAYNNWASGVYFAGSDSKVGALASYSSVSPRYFNAVGTRILAGRGITEHDTQAGRHVAVVNKAFADRLLSGKQAIGSYFGPDRKMKTEYEIIGIADDSKYGDPSKPAGPMYFPAMAQTATYEGQPDLPATRQASKDERFKHYAGNLIVRYDGDPSVAANTVRRTLQSINPDIPIERLTTYQEQVGDVFRQRELIMRLAVVFGGLALVLASLGIYGVTAYAVGRRTSEIGIRMALGADRASVLQMILGNSLVQTAIGLAIGVPIALGAGRYLQSQLFGVRSYDPAILGTAALLLFLSALLASVIPARRASRIEPMQALRSE